MLKFIEEEDKSMFEPLECHITFPLWNEKTQNFIRDLGWKVTAYSDTDKYLYVTTYAHSHKAMAIKIKELIDSVAYTPDYRIKIEKIVFDTKRGDSLDKYFNE